MTDLRTLMRSAATDPDPATDDLGAVLTQGRRRVRRRRLGTLAGGCAVVLAAVAAPLGLGGVFGDETEAPPSAGSGAPDDIVGPTLQLQDATAAREGTDYEVLLEQRNQDLESEQGAYYQGVTDDAQAIFEDQRASGGTSQWSLVDTSTGDRTDIPPAPRNGLSVLQATRDRIVFAPAAADASADRIEIVVFDRSTSQWRVVTVRGPGSGLAQQAAVGPDDRIYLTLDPMMSEEELQEQPGDTGTIVPATVDGVPGRLWSASLTGPADVRDEGISVGAFGIDDQGLVWTVPGEDGDRVHVRDWSTGAEREFDPQVADGCSVVSLSSFLTSQGRRVALSQYCGESGGVRDDRVQIVDDGGGSVATIQDDGLLEAGAAGALVRLTAYDGADQGNYLFDPDSGRFLRLGQSRSVYDMGGPTPPGYVIWDEAVDGSTGTQQYVARLL